MRRPRHAYLVDNAIDASLSAIEIYNKPNFRYREEAFAILMINAWELLLKARILKENNNKLRSIEIWEPRKKKDGTNSLRAKPRKTRSGNVMTIGITGAAKLVKGYAKNTIDDLCIQNINLLTELRDNAIHFHNPGKGLQKRVHEIGIASLRNFVRATKDWFDEDLSRYTFFLMPLAFETPTGMIQTVFPSESTAAAEKLLKLLTEETDANPFDPARPFNVGVQIDMQFVRKAATDALRVRQDTANPHAIPVAVSDDELYRDYTWGYDRLCNSLRERYSDFKANKKFHDLRKSIESDERYCRIRLLDPHDPQGYKKKFFNPNVLQFFDQHYTR